MHMEMRRRHVTIKLSDNNLLNGEVRGEEAQGLWLAMAERASLPGFPADVQEPIIFVPFTQMVWLGTSAAHRPDN
jgi:hypothetical protein